MNQSERPKCLPPQWEFVPEELKKIPHWVVWKYNLDEGKWKKPLYQTDGTTHAKSNDPSTWTSYESVEVNGNDLIRSGLMDGIGFVPTLDLSLIAIDMDDCVEWDQEKPIFDSWALAAINKLGDVYIEFTPSRKGLRILVKGTVERTRRFDQCKMEFYSHGQYVTITGDCWNAGPIADRSQEVNEIIAKLDERYGRSDNSDKNIRQDAKQNFISIDERLRIAFSSSKGEKIKALFDGGFAGFEDDSPDGFDASRRDMALCRELAFYSDNSSELLAEMMWQSQCQRSKWNRPDNGSTWLGSLIKKVLDTEQKFYEPPQVITPDSPKREYRAQLERKNRYMLSELTEAALEYRKRSDIFGLQCKFENLNRIYRPRPDLLTTWTGKPGAGKSTFILAYLLYFSMMHRMRMGVCTFELNPPERVQLELINIWSQMNVFDDSLDDDEYRRNVSEIGDICTVFNLDFEQRSVFGIEPLIEQEISERGLGIFYLDPFTELQPENKLLGKYTDFASQQLSALKEMTVEKHLITHLVCHPTKQGSAKNQDLTLTDINGSGDFERKTDFGIVISREKGTQTTVLHLQKLRDRLTGVEDGKCAFDLSPEAYYFKEVPVPIRLKTDKKEEEERKEGVPF